MNGSCGLNRKFLRSSATCRWAPQTTSESTGASHRADPDVELAVLPDSICRKRKLVVAAPWLLTDVLDDVHRERIS